MMKIEILLDVMILAILGFSLLICVCLLILIWIYYRPFHVNVPILLIFNTYAALFFASIMMIIIYIYNLHGDLYPLLSVKDRWCEIRSYLVNVCFCALYYSCLLKSIFRLFRIVFYQSNYLQSYLVFIIAILLQWLISFLLILSNLFNDDYQYLPQQYRCWISFENSRGLLLAATIIYICPLFTILLIYIHIIRYVRQRNPTEQRQKKSIDRDLLVLKRITIFVLVIIVIGLPTVAILFIWMISGTLIPLAYHIQGLSMSLGIFIATICFAFITPQMQQIFHQKKRHVHASVTRSSHEIVMQQEKKELV